MGDGTLATSAAARTILALDLGKFKSVACVLEAEAEAERGSGGGHRFETIATSPSAVAELLAEVRPDRLVIEACSIAGWVCDLARPHPRLLSRGRSRGCRERTGALPKTPPRKPAAAGGGRPAGILPRECP
jgi:hypothetical protein